MSALFWFRHAHCVRFTSLRDMSLHPYRALHALPRVRWRCSLCSHRQLMRGLRA